jgi:mannosyltransferase OCH1-like enzyme
LEKHPTWKKLFDSQGNVGARSDVLRYLILKEFGGVYVDMDCHCLKNIDELLLIFEKEQKEVALPKDKVGLSNFFIISIEKATFWTFVEARMQKDPSKFKNLPVIGVLFTTGPFMISETAREKKELVFTIGLDMYCREKCKNEAAFFMHESAGTWVPKYILSIRDNWIVCSGLLLIVILFFWRWSRRNHGWRKTCCNSKFNRVV